MCWESVTKWWGPDEKCSNLFSPADRPQPMFPHDTLWMWERKQTWLPVERFGNINYNKLLSSVKLGIRFWKHLNDFLTPIVEFSFLCRAEVRIDWERLLLMSNTKYFHDKLTVSLFSLKVLTWKPGWKSSSCDVWNMCLMFPKYSPNVAIIFKMYI